MLRQAESILPTKWGLFQMMAYSDSPNTPKPHIAMISNDTDLTKPVVVRIHSECMTGDIFSSLRCDCGEQLERALELTAQKGGIVLYLRQEGRGIGIINKMKAYNLQDKGVNTVDANIHLGFEADERTYGMAIEMLTDLGITEIHLMTNNPLKVEAFDNSAVKVLSRLPLEIPAKKENVDYLRTKKSLMGHLLNLE
ncbi:MAG: GTP cyclohydrolase II [Chitinophagales bacterium]